MALIILSERRSLEGRRKEGVYGGGGGGEEGGIKGRREKEQGILGGRSYTHKDFSGTHSLTCT